jgi:microcystin-dependent protein
MSRFKTFDATGISPGGVLFSGDLNAIQDRYADLSNFSQAVDVSVLRVGDSTLQLLKFGSAEFRLTGALRTDGILRGLGGLYSGQFTTAGRPGSGLRPYGLMIFNTDSSRYEVNIGTDASPNWQATLLAADVFQLPIGASIEYAGSADLSATVVLEDGRELSRTTYATLFALIGTNYGSGNGTTTFNIPDSRGRVSVGPDNMGTARGAAGRLTASAALGNSAGEEKHTMTIAEMVQHNHSGATGTGTTGTESADHVHSGTTGAAFAGPQNVPPQTGFTSFLEPSSGTVTNYIVTNWQSTSHSHSFTTGGRSASHTHAVPALSISNQGSTTPFNVMQPYVVKNKLIRIA